MMETECQHYFNTIFFHFYRDLDEALEMGMDWSLREGSCILSFLERLKLENEIFVLKTEEQIAYNFRLRFSQLRYSKERWLIHFFHQWNTFSMKFLSLFQVFRKEGGK